MAAGAGVIATTRSASSSASSTSFVISTMVAPLFEEMSTSSSCSRARVSASSADRGSSSSSTSGSMASARATATRWRMPPDSSAGRRSTAWDSPTMSMYLVARAARPARDRPGATESTASATLPSTESHGMSE